MLCWAPMGPAKHDAAGNLRAGRAGAAEAWCAGRADGGRRPEAIVRLGISHVPEGRRVFPGLTVRENIMLGAWNRKRRAAANAGKTEVDGMLDAFADLKRLEHALGWTLSGASCKWSRWRAG